MRHGLLVKAASLRGVRKREPAAWSGLDLPDEIAEPVDLAAQLRGGALRGAAS